MPGANEFNKSSPNMLSRTRLASTGFCRRLFSSERALRACIIDYHALNRYEDYLGEIQSGRVEFALHNGADALLHDIRNDGLRIGLVMPRYPVESDSKRFLAHYGSRFNAVISSDEALNFPEAAPLTAAVEALSLDPKHVMVVASQRIDTDYAPLLQAAKSAGCFTCALLEDGAGRPDPKPMYRVRELGEVSLLLQQLNDELAY